MSDATGNDAFTIGRRESGNTVDFYLLERGGHELGEISSVRICLNHHRAALTRRLAALDAVLATEEPEFAERLLLDHPRVRVDEVTLSAPHCAECVDHLLRGLLGRPRSSTANHPIQPPALSAGRERPTSVTKLYVANLPFTFNDEQLAELFSSAGTVEFARVATDRESGRSRGFGFVTMATPDAAEIALRQFDGYREGGRPLTVAYARERAAGTAPLH